MVFFQYNLLKMIKKIFLTYLKKIILIYFFIFPGKFKFKFLSNLNFKIIDFNNYEKNKNLIFRNNFFKIEKNSIIYNYDFINICSKLGGKRGIEQAKLGVLKCYEVNKFKSNNFVCFVDIYQYPLTILVVSVSEAPGVVTSSLCLVPRPIEPPVSV